MILALAGLWPLLRKLQIRSWNDLGFAPLRLHWKKSAAGFSLGFGSLAVLSLMTICFGVRTISVGHSEKALVAKLLEVTATAVIIAILEETLFRGALYGALRKVIRPWPYALLLSSGIYSLLHFFGKAAAPDSIEWTSGLTTLSTMLAGFADFDSLFPSCINLLIVGIILGVAYERTGNLYFSIGLHAGWIFWLKSYGTLTIRIFKGHSALWGTAKLVDGWLATALLAAVFAFLFFWRKNSQPAADVA